MGKDPIPTVHELQRPEKLREVLAREEKDVDCLSCRILGELFLWPFSRPFPTQTSSADSHQM